MQHFAEHLCSSHFITLQKRHHAAAIGLLCKLLNGTCQEHLQMFCPVFLSSICCHKDPSVLLLFVINALVADRQTHIPMHEQK